MTYLEAIRQFLKFLARDASYDISFDSLDHLQKYTHILSYREEYSLPGTDLSISYRSTTGRLSASGTPLTPAEFYKNSILGLVNNNPSYDINYEWGCSNFDRSNLCFDLGKSTLSLRINNLKGPFIGQNAKNILSELILSSPDDFVGNYLSCIAAEDFGKESFCRLFALVEFVTECFEATGQQVLILELGPGTGFWINKAMMLLEAKSVPFLVVAVEFFTLNSLNTLHMSQFFTNSSSMVCINANINTFDWTRFIADFPAFSTLPIVVHSSGCVNPFVRPNVLLHLFQILSEYKLYGGCHREGDAFPQLTNDQKNTFIAYAIKHKLGIPQPFLGMTKVVGRKSVNSKSFFDSSYESPLNTALSKFSSSVPTRINSYIPWQPLQNNPLLYTEWRVVRV